MRATGLLHPASCVTLFIAAGSPPGQGRLNPAWARQAKPEDAAEARTSCVTSWRVQGTAWENKIRPSLGGMKWPSPHHPGVRPAAGGSVLAAVGPPGAEGFQGQARAPRLSVGFRWHCMARSGLCKERAVKLLGVACTKAAQNPARHGRRLPGSGCGTVRSHPFGYSRLRIAWTMRRPAGGQSPSAMPVYFPK